MTFLKITLAAALFAVTSCDSTKKNAQSEATTQTTKAMETKMMEEGFKKGTIVASKEEGDCPYTIQLEENGETLHYDPINLDAQYKQDGEKIWFTFRGLRMMNRCQKATPIEIEQMQKRAE